MQDETQKKLELERRRLYEEREVRMTPQRLCIPASSMKPDTWVLVDWPYADGCPKCWMMRIYRGCIYLYDDKYFEFTVACGHNSDRTYSGSHFRIEHIRTLDDAKLHLFRRNKCGEFD